MQLHFYGPCHLVIIFIQNIIISLLYMMMIIFFSLNKPNFLFLYQGYKPPDEGPSEYQTIPLNKIEDFGVHCKQYVFVPVIIGTLY